MTGHLDDRPEVLQEPDCRIEISITLPKAAGRRRARLMTRVGYVTRRAAATGADFCPVGVFVMF